MNPFNILVIGSGGREHALCQALRRSPLCRNLSCAPGNAGIAQDAVCVELETGDHAAVIDFCQKQEIGLVVVGPEVPLVDGLADSLRAAGIRVFGPSKAAAQLEGSKEFMKRLCDRYGIPTARYESFTAPNAALDYVRAQGAPIVVKADGLAAGKGVTVAATIEEAEAAVREAFSGKYGAAGERVVIEECLEGEEISIFAFTDGTALRWIGDAQDHKRVGEGDTGPNTGGMGTYSPTPLMTAALKTQITQSILEPTVRGMAKDGIPYQGVLFAGLMLTAEGPKLLEYNIRFGDPETQVILPRLQTDLVALMLATSNGTLADTPEVALSNEAALCVVMASHGYPGDYSEAKGSIIRGLEDAAVCEHVTLFHAGTRRTENGDILAVGGRVLGVTALAPELADAQARAYRAVEKINWPEGFCRRDIGWRALKKEPISSEAAASS